MDESGRIKSAGKPLTANSGQLLLVPIGILLFSLCHLQAFVHKTRQEVRVGMETSGGEVLVGRCNAVNLQRYGENGVMLYVRR